MLHFARISPIFAALLLLNGRTAQAAPKSSTTPSAARAKAGLKRLAALYAQASGITFTCTRLTPNLHGSGTLTFVIQGSAEKPNKFHLEISQEGKPVGIIDSDGVHESLYSPVTQQYATFPARKSYGGVLFDETAIKELKACAVFAPEDLEIGAATSPIYTFFINTPDVAQNPMVGMYDSFTYSSAQVVEQGMPVTRVFQTAIMTQNMTFEGKKIHIKGGAIWEHDLDNATGLPHLIVYSTMIYRDGKRKVAEFEREAYSQIHLNVIPLPASTFSWTPPAEAKLMPIPEDKTPPLPGIASPLPSHH